MARNGPIDAEFMDLNTYKETKASHIRVLQEFNSKNLE